MSISNIDFSEMTAAQLKEVVTAAIKAYRELSNNIISLQKPQRVRDQKYLNYVKTLPCLCFNGLDSKYRCNSGPVDPDHITSRGAGGGDTPDNVWPLCRTHHNLRHARGLPYITERYPKLKKWLLENKRYDILDLIERKKGKK